jgi:hypothetical protein
VPWGPHHLFSSFNICVLQALCWVWHSQSGFHCPALF